jgi:Abortive infection C-terminus
VIGPLLPEYVRRYPTTEQFWPFIKELLPTYAARREHIWSSLRPAVEAAAGVEDLPIDGAVGGSLAAYDENVVHAAWKKALDRRLADPDGAITSARTLLESVCKHILDDRSITYDDKADIPKLYDAVARALKLAPSLHSEDTFKRILGGCTSVVEGIGAVRNKHGDAHGQGRRAARVAQRHVTLVVNLAGSMALFLVETHAAN